MRAIAVLMVALGLGCGGSEAGKQISCGDGTTLKGSICVADDQCGQGTNRIDGKCVAASVAKVAQARAELESIAERICKCKDAECSDQMMRELDGLSRKFGGIRDEDMSAEERKAIMALAMRIGECAKKLPMSEYAAKARTTEARQFLKKMYDGARAYYMAPGVGRAAASGAARAKQFPEPGAGPVPPLGTCCKQEGGSCQPQASLWTGPTWEALQFSVDDPHYYSYEYEVDNKAKDGPTFTVSAYGDLDCDGVYSTFRMKGAVNSQYPDGPAGTAAIYREKELE